MNFIKQHPFISNISSYFSNYKNRYITLLLHVILVLIVLILPLFLRSLSGNPLIISDYNYEQLSFVKNNSFSFDNYLLHSLFSFVPKKMYTSFFIFLGVLSYLLFLRIWNYICLKNYFFLNIKVNRSILHFLGSLIFLFNPLFVKSFLSFSWDGLLLFLFLLFWYCFFKLISLNSDFLYSQAKKNKTLLSLFKNSILDLFYRNTSFKKISLPFFMVVFLNIFLTFIIIFSGILLLSASKYFFFLLIAIILMSYFSEKQFVSVLNKYLTKKNFPFFTKKESSHSFVKQITHYLNKSGYELYFHLKYILFLALFLFITLYVHYTFSFSSVHETTFSFFNDFLLEFGSEFGFSFLYVMLFLIGLVFLWRFKRKLLSQLIVLLLVGIAIMVGDAYLIIFLLPFSLLFVSYAVYLLLNYNFRIRLFSYLTFFLLLIGFLITYSDSVHSYVNSYPDQELFDGMKYLADYSSGNILTSSNYFGLLDYYKLSYVGNEWNFDFFEKLFHTRDLSYVKDIFNLNDISYVLITDDMKNTIWRHKNKGLLFLVYQSDSFSLVYESNGVEIFSYNG